MKFLTLGSGVQLYTCSSPALVYLNVGAAATLFDVSQAGNQESLPEDVMKGKADPTKFKQIGKHFFKQVGKSVPVFEINGQQVTAAKEASAKSPGKPERNVDWLQLKATSGTFAKTVFRTATRGGQLAGVKCKAAEVGKPAKEVKYAALYSFFA